MLTMTSSSASQTLQKPKYPLSAYNLFFQIERKRILENKDENEIPITKQMVEAVSAEHKLKGKRVHRKTHGKIGFRELARTVAQRWKKIDKDTKQILEDQAVIEKQEHARLHKQWKAQEDAREKVVKEQQEQDQNKQMLQQILGPSTHGAPRAQTLGNILGQIEAEMARLGGSGIDQAARMLLLQNQQDQFQQPTGHSSFPQGIIAQAAAANHMPRNSCQQDALMQQAATLSAAMAVLQHDADLQQQHQQQGHSGNVPRANFPRNDSFSGLLLQYQEQQQQQQQQQQQPQQQQHHQQHHHQATTFSNQLSRNPSFSGLQQLQEWAAAAVGNQVASAGPSNVMPRSSSFSGLVGLDMEGFFDC